MVLGHLQRGGGPTTFDRVLSSMYGAHAIRLIIEKKFGKMVRSDPPDIDEVDIADAVDQIPHGGPQWISCERRPEQWESVSAIHPDTRTRSAKTDDAFAECTPITAINPLDSFFKSQFKGVMALGCSRLTRKNCLICCG